MTDEFGIDGTGARQCRTSFSRVCWSSAPAGWARRWPSTWAAAGVGHIALVDDDEVDLTNLQRQVAHTQARVGMRQGRICRAGHARHQPRCFHRHPRHARDEALLSRLVADADVVVDCCDNFATRQAVNRACVVHAKPLVAGAAIRFDGQLSVYDTRDAASPCYACLFPPDADFEETRCAVLGVFGPVVGTIGTLQASEALKLLAGIGPSLVGKLLMFDGRSTSFDTLRVARDPQCGVCAQRPVSPLTT
jgi:molybdopterin/thiamine biosynthesis adenylyltransferase